MPGQRRQEKGDMSDMFLIASSRDSTIRAVQAALHEDQLRSIIASDGLQALDLALDRSPSAIFLGTELTKVDALQVARALRALDQTEHVPIIFLAENQTEVDKLTKEHLPFTECLIAPINPHEVKTRVAKALHGGSRIGELRSAENGAEIAAISDPLTHVYQRRYAMHRLGYEASRSVRYKNPLSVLLVDVDNLKEINSEHGIVIGDTVLVETAQVIFKTSRRIDIIGRYDTQDFIMILPQTVEPGAMALADRICNVVSERKFLNGKLDLHVTVSVGVAGAAGADLAENLALVGRAATALDQAKRSGKNRVEKG
jgi:diguanylate cyclase (GGDEF)-like protein